MKTFTSLLLGALLSFSLAACGTGAGSGIPCPEGTECLPMGETCILTSCAASTPTCQNTCQSDAECDGGFDSAPSGASCLLAEVDQCSSQWADGQVSGEGFCVE